MNDPLDHLLVGLRESSVDRSLDGLEAGVWTRIDGARNAEVRPGVVIRVQLAVAATTMIIGLAIGSITVGHKVQPESRPLATYAEAGPWGALQSGGL